LYSPLVYARGKQDKQGFALPGQQGTAPGIVVGASHQSSAHRIHPHILAFLSKGFITPKLVIEEARLPRRGVSIPAAKFHCGSALKLTDERAEATASSGANQMEVIR
jgi:hypothetical protein